MQGCPANIYNWLEPALPFLSLYELIDRERGGKGERAMGEESMGDTMSSSSSSNAYFFVLYNYPLISAIDAQSTKFFTTRYISPSSLP